MTFFKATDIVKEYAGHRALDKVTVEVPENSIYGLLGPNGAGKTTLIRIINQITAPDSGKVIFHNREMKPDDIFDIGYLPEERGLYKKMKVGEQALYLAQLKGLSRQEAAKRLKEWFEKFEMGAWWNKKVEELSKGMQQKVQFIVTIIHKPGLLIFDEPFTGFDPINTRQLKEEILQLKKEGATIIFSTHDMPSVEELCDHITLINRSRTILQGATEEIRHEYGGHEYEIRFTGKVNLLTATLNTDYKILDHHRENGHSLIRLSLREDASPNDMLASFLKSGRIVSFRELVPSMNDVFIQAVEKENEQDTTHKTP
ncbi:MAG: ABC transporter ATP-binding protein [Chlorobi bacterium]|nr:ABC transporter ATP-binding protein [Chlorobiota bacterium]